MSAQSSARNSSTVDLFVISAPAGLGSQLAAALIDLAALLAAAVVARLLVPTGAQGAVAALLAAAAVLALILRGLALHGRWLGGLALGIRFVDQHSAAPAGRRLIFVALSGRLRAFDLRRGRDPLAPALAKFQFPEQAMAAARRMSDVGARRPAIVSLDSGQRLMLHSAMIIGRGPFTSMPDKTRSFEWADLSRTLSKLHVRLEWDGQVAWVTDLGATNGTALEVSGQFRRLPAQKRVALPPRAKLALGDRFLSVEAPSD